MPGSREEAIEVLEACFDALSSLDADRLVENYTDDYVLELPYFKPDEPLVVKGRRAVYGYVTQLLEVQRMRFTLTGSHWIPEEQLLIAEYTSEGEFLDTGEPYANRYVGYWYFEGRRLRRLREYYDPEAPRASALKGSS